MIDISNHRIPFNDILTMSLIFEIYYPEPAGSAPKAIGFWLVKFSWSSIQNGALSDFHLRQEAKADPKKKIFESGGIVSKGKGFTQVSNRFLPKATTVITLRSLYLSILFPDFAELP